MKRKPWELSPAELKAAVSVNAALEAARKPAKAETSSPAPARTPKPKSEKPPAPAVEVLSAEDVPPPADMLRDIHRSLFDSIEAKLPEGIGPDSSAEDRSSFAAAAICRGCWTSWIADALQSVCLIDRQQAGKDIERARQRIREGLASSRQNLRVESAAFYSSIAADPRTETKYRLTARQQIDKLYGLHPPSRTMQVVEMVDGERSASKLRQEALRETLQAMTVDQLETLADLQTGMRKRLQVAELERENSERRSDEDGSDNEKH